MLEVTGSAHVQPSTLYSVLFPLLLFYILLLCPLHMCPRHVCSPVHLSDADEIIVIIEETPSVVNPVEERSFVVHPTQYIRAHDDQRIQHLVPLFMLSTPLLIRQAVMLLGLGYRA